LKTNINVDDVKTRPILRESRAESK